MKRTNLKDKDNNTLIQKLWYPIGTIYENENDISEEIKKCFYGTWEFYGKGKFLVGVDESDADFKANKTGGSKELQSHTHVEQLPAGDYSYPIVAGTGQGSSVFGVTSNIAGTATNKSVLTKSAGTGNSGNLPPYQAVYRWKRVS